MSGRLKIKCARLAVDHAEDDYWLASDLPATIFEQTQHEIRCIFIDLYSAISNKNFQPTVQ